MTGNIVLLRDLRLGAIWLMVAASLWLMACRDTKAANSLDIQAAKDAVTEFIYEAYRPEGDTSRAYTLLATDTRATCSASEFARLATMAKQIVADRQLTIRSITNTRISDGTATLRMEIFMTDRRASFIPPEATLVKQGGRWYYKVTSDPECRDPGVFFRLGTPATVATAVFEGSSSCEQGYPFVCIPLYPPDLDCDDIPYRKFIAVPPDPHGLDADGDSFGCNE